MEKTTTHKQKILDALTWEFATAPTNPHVEDDPKYPMAHWYITVKNKTGASMRFHYSMGSGLCEQWLKTSKRSGIFGYRHLLLVEGPAYFTPKRLVEYAQERKMNPSDDDMALCLCNIALDNEPSFKEFCANFGYDDDSIKARNTWEACLKQQQSLMGIFPQTVEWWAEAREAIDQ